MPTALFRADASPSIGGGHVMRCLTLARFLQDCGWECAFAVRAGTRETIPLLNADVGEIFKVSGPFDDEPAKIGQLGFNWNLLIVDHYNWDVVFEKQCRSWAKRIMVIDDLANRTHDCDILLDQTYGRDQQDYMSLAPDGARLLVGADYALLRPEFSNYRRAAIERREKEATLKRVLINLGASDPYGLTAQALRAIGETGLDVTVDVMTGSDNPSDIGLGEIASEAPQDVVFHGFDADMAKLMYAADLAIGAAGATSWERCCLGLPTLMIVTADNQEMIARELEKVGAVKLIANDRSVMESIVKAIAMLNRDRQYLGQMSRAAAGICDGYGVERVTKHTVKMFHEGV